MKLTKLSIQNLLGIKRAEIENPKKIIFVSGNNGAGKSSVRDAVEMALTGELCRVSLKKEAPLLINGADMGMVEVNTDHHYFYTSITKNDVTTKGQSADPSPALPYVLDMHKFANSSPDERRKLLFEITGCKATQEEVKKRMLARGIDEPLIECILPFLRSGFPEAQKEAQSKAREEKASWRTLTGETYGEKKAETWKAKANVNLEEIQNLVMEKEKELNAIDADFETASQRFGAMKANADRASTRNAEIVRLRDQAGKIERIKTKLEADRRDLTSWQAMVEKARRDASNLTAGDTVCRCPECEAELIFLAQDKKLISHGDLRGDEFAADNLPQYERNLELFTNSVRNGERDLANAESAKAKLEALTKEIEGAPGDEAMIAMTARIDELRTIKKTLNDTINKLLAEEKTLREGDQKTEQAMTHHRQVVAWEKIAAVLAPDGIPQELLNNALQPFKERLPTTAWVANKWLTPALGNDMNITVEGRPYALLSESEQWRVDCLITEAISYLSGLKFFALDRMDVLDGKGRGELLNFLEELASLGHIESALVMGTLKREQAETVAESFDNISAYWMQDGVLKRVNAAAAEEAA